MAAMAEFHKEMRPESQTQNSADASKDGLDSWLVHGFRMERSGAVRIDAWMRTGSISRNFYQSTCFSATGLLFCLPTTPRKNLWKISSPEFAFSLLWARFAWMLRLTTLSLKRCKAHASKNRPVMEVLCVAPRATFVAC